jgi:putative ABC transport system permease protein
METLFKDIRYGIRTLLKHPGFTATAVITLALGIGVNTAVFSVADAFLFKPLPLPDIGHLMALRELRPGETSETSRVSPANLFDWKEQSKSFDALSFYQWQDLNLTGAGLPERLQGFGVSADFFGTLGVTPMLGRTFLPEEDQSGREAEVVLGYNFWQRRFAGDPDVVGRTIRLDGKSHTVIGVMSKGFEFPPTADLWIPLALDPKERANRRNHYLTALARLKPPVSSDEADADLKAIASRLGEAYPGTNRGWSARVVPLRAFITGDYTREYTFLLLGAVAFVLLIACANVANLQFARATSREKEMAVRAALGASRWRIGRQLLTENVLLSLLGALLSLALAQWSIKLILAYMPDDVAKFIVGWKQISLDYRAFLFTMGIAVVSGVVSGILPALQSSNPDLNEALKEGGRGSSAGRARHRIRRALVVAEIALSLILVVGAGLMMKGSRALADVNQNFAPESLLTMRVNLPETKYQNPQQLAAFYDQTLQRLQAVPEAESAATVSGIPFGAGSTGVFSIEGNLPQAAEVRTAKMQSISPNYFHTIKIPLRVGREFRDSDTPESLPVAVISDGLARHYWPDQSPLGRRIKVGADDSKNAWLTIVGVVGDADYEWTERRFIPALYRPYRQAPGFSAYFAVRTTGDPERLSSTMRAQVAAVDPEQPVFEIKSLARVIHEDILGLAYVAVMLSVMGVIALSLAAVGVYGVMAYSVSERTHEIGVRMALGAQVGDVLRLFLKQGLKLTIIGGTLGLAGAYGLTRALSSLVFGISATDPVTFVLTTLALAAVALIASYLPARRAAKVDPLVALRYE